MAPLTSRLRSVNKNKNKVKTPSRTRPARKHISYREQTSDSDDEDFNHYTSDDHFEAPSSPPQQRRAPPPPTPTSPQSKTSKKRKAYGPAHRRQNGVLKTLKLDEDDTDLKKCGHVAIQFTGKTMPWSTLPYHILLAIFDYASRPLMKDILQPTSSINWLCNVALCCKAFAEPALSALYYAPPLYPPSRAHNLTWHLATHKDTSTFNYGAKIKYIEMEADSTMLHKYLGYDRLDLGALVSLTPQLRGIALHYSDDLARIKGKIYRNVPGGKAVYQHSMITALRANKIMLHDWTWNHVLAKGSQKAFPLAPMKDFHMMPSFQTLKSLTFVKYLADPLEKGRHCEDILAEAISLLPSLTDLHFHLSSVNDRLLSKLPDKLETLEIVECLELESAPLDGFLAAKGSNIRQLILDHNQSMNLSFLTNLGRSCPRLELLKADLRYFGTLNVTRDTDPKYEALLLDDERPAWPRTLRILELFHLRKWNLQTAELFFSSLIESSESLPDLRQLRIKASLDESGWRDRIAFRNSWTEKLLQVFLRTSPPPNPHFTSIAAFKAFKAQQTKGRTAIREDKRKTITRAIASTPSNENTVQANQVKRAPRKPDSNESESNSDAPLAKVRRSTRAKTQPENFYALSESSSTRPMIPRRRRRRKGSNDSSSEDSAIDDDGILEPDTRPKSMTHEPELYIQGLCDVVDVLIDNLRPTEEQLNEDDFLDEEVSGDEDWNGDDDMSGDDGIAF